MRFVVLGLAACHSSAAMRPSLSRAAVSNRIASIGDIVSKISSPTESLASLKEASNIVTSILSEQGPVDDHTSDEDRQLLSSVIDLVEKTIYSSMDDSHSSDVAALADAVQAASQCNVDIAARQSPEGDLGLLHQHVQEKQTELNRLQGIVDEKTEANNTKWGEFDSHMQMIAEPPACPGLPARTMPALDVFFEKSEYSIWFTAQQASYTVVRDAFKAADEALEYAIEQYDIQKAVRDTQYCDWKSELEAACAAFDKCFADASDYYTKTLVPRVTASMNERIEVKRAGDTLVHQIKFLLGQVEDQQTPSISTSRYEIDFPSLPAKGLCDLSPLDADEWVPAVECNPSPTIVWKMGAPGESCDQTCSTGGEFCAGNQEWGGWPKSEKEILDVAAKVGHTCQKIRNRCEPAAPLVTADGIHCDYCTLAGADAWRTSYMPMCENKFGTRQRLCPCQQA